jgi:predicted O-linked N-acetylglucosamine transferase (SPINDLY family)
MLSPNYTHAYNNRALTLKENKQFEQALRSCDIALILSPNYPEAHNNRGVILKELGRFEEALPAFRKALDIMPDHLNAHSNLLFTLNYIDEIPTETRVDQARQYGVAAKRNRTHAYDHWPETKDPGVLRIGLVSGDLRNHPVGYFLEGFLSQIDTSAFEIVAYSADRYEDSLTSRLKSNFSLWRPLHGLDNAAAAELIHSDGIHILIDLSGHTAKNRLPVFAFKPAPVQASWLGYFATTGVEQIDYLIGDPYVTPVEERTHFVEKIKRLPETYLCFTPPNQDINVGGLPALDNGFITFGSFNNLSKMNAAVIALWARVLRATSNSRLFMKAAQLADAEVVEAIKKSFQSSGVNSDRLVFEGQTNRMDYFNAYNKVDIALDPFPYPGGTTSVEGLWMGVPVIARKGNRFIAHNGETIAHNSGQSHWIAEDDDDYVRKAIDFSSNLSALALTRAGLRDQLLASPLCDARRFTRHFQQAMLEMWSDYQNQS